MSSPTDSDALAALRTLRAYFDAGASMPTLYTQDALPPGAGSRAAYLERHRQRVREGVSGWTRSGQARAVTREAWVADVEAETTRGRARRTPPRLEVVRGVDDQLDAALGIRTRRTAR